MLDGIAFEALIADRAYDRNALRDELKERGAAAAIPPRSNRVEEIAYDREMYKWRHVVEHFFVVGGGLLAFVNVPEGQRLARQAEQAFSDAAR